MAQPTINQDSRLKRAAGQSRASRQEADRPFRENRELSDAERREAYKKSFFQSHLPDLPPIKGFHVCWLTTTNPKDPVHGRQRIGYQLIRAEEMPGWEHATVKTGEWAGCVGINEMLAAKLPLHLFEEYMTFSHHEAPLDEERSIREEVEKQQNASRGVIGRITLEDGTAELGKYTPAPVFAEEFGET